jgi:hypothetical protein
MRIAAVRIVLILSACAVAVSANGFGQSIVVGVLEDRPGHYAGDQNFRAVRAVFKKNGPDWQPFPSYCPDQDCLKRIASNYPAEATWTVAFDGRNLGQITTRTPKEYKWYSSVGQAEITSGPVPAVGERAAEFAGWLEVPVFRPIVTNSQPYFKDPESWKPAHLSSDLVSLLRERFRKKFPEVTNCENADENAAKPWSYRDQDVKILKSYSSRKGWSIARVRLEEYRCDGPADDPFSDQWFAISPGREVSFLDEGMWLVDAGDYDNDGKSELVFSIDRYNRGGYELFYNDFKRHVTFEFGYH